MPSNAISEVNQIQSESYDEEYDSSLGLMFLLLIAVGFSLVCIGAGIVITIFGILFVFGLVSIGVLSASIIVGLNQRSLAKGFKTFLILLSTVTCTMVFGALFGFLNEVVHWSNLSASIATGSAIGLVTGLGFGLVAYHVLRLLTTYFRQKLKMAMVNKGI